MIWVAVLAGSLGCYVEKLLGYALPRSVIERDSFNVPHVTAPSHDDGVWAAGWIAGEDRGLLLQQARYNARVAAIGSTGRSTGPHLQGHRDCLISLPDQYKHDARTRRQG